MRMIQLLLHCCRPILLMQLARTLLVEATKFFVMCAIGTIQLYGPLRTMGNLNFGIGNILESGTRDVWMRGHNSPAKHIEGLDLLPGLRPGVLSPSVRTCVLGH